MARVRGGTRASLSLARHTQNPRDKDRDTVSGQPRGRGEAEAWKDLEGEEAGGPLWDAPLAHGGFLPSLPPFCWPRARRDPQSPMWRTL